jgi:hypothetical protein
MGEGGVNPAPNFMMRGNGRRVCRSPDQSDWRSVWSPPSNQTEPPAVGGCGLTLAQ